MNLESDVRGKDLHTSLMPANEVDVGPRLPVTVGLPVAGTRMCADQAIKNYGMKFGAEPVIS